jgi:4-hydroxy-4-methyl-2-oxoglutarate aldolase
VEWNNDNELFELLRSFLYTPVVGDVLDSLGCYHQFLPPAVRPLREHMVVIGRAMPVLIADVHGPQKEPFGKLTQALDQMLDGEVYIATGTVRCASWGEIMTAAARARGGTGAVINGFHRDTPRVLKQNWPVFSIGSFAQDARVRSQVIDYRCPLEIEGAGVSPGDLVFGDVDGVVVIPRRVENEVVAKSLEKARDEKIVRREIEAGTPTADVFSRYGIL